MYDKEKEELTDFHATITACQDLFQSKRKLLHAIAFLLAWTFGDLISGGSDINQVKKVNTEKQSSVFGPRKSVGLAALLDSQLLANQMQSAYEDAMREDQELEAALGFYQML